MRKSILPGLAAAGLILGLVLPASAQPVKPVVVIKTNMGEITVELDPQRAPLTVKNFLGYVDAKFYDGTIIHRVEKAFVIQGGGLTPSYVEKPTRAPIKNESTNKLSNAPYTIAMARTSDPNSATAQFYINVADNFPLDFESALKPGYAVFGKVVSGQETVDKIRKVPTGNSGPHQNVPTTPVVIQKAECA